MEKENKREEKVFYAHTSSHGNEPLEDHLRLVGDLAETFGADFESSKITKTIGNVHDINFPEYWKEWKVRLTMRLLALNICIMSVFWEMKKDDILKIE